MDYRQSGVDIDAGNETVRRIKSLARIDLHPRRAVRDRIVRRAVQARSRTALREPVLVSSADGVGTKLKVAFMTGRHDTVGADLVNHCVNDILVQGARPLFFLDYLATGRLSPDVAEQVVAGVARGCRENGCALIGGETAEMPGFYADGEYDLAGFIVGIVDRAQIVDVFADVEFRGDAAVPLPCGEQLQHLKFPLPQVPVGRLCQRTGRRIQREGDGDVGTPAPGITSTPMLPLRASTRWTRRAMAGADADSSPGPSSRTLMSRLAPSQSHCVRTRRTPCWSTIASTSPRTMARAACATSPGSARPLTGGSMNCTSIPLKFISGRRSSRRRWNAEATGSSTRSVVRSLSVRRPTRALAATSVAAVRAQRRPARGT